MSETSISGHKKISSTLATAICGNDISSSCLYVSAITIVYAGQYAWISLLIVAFVLFLFRKIYGEVVGALPLNGGAYNALLNTTSKSVASVAATLTLLSYMATAVISASEAMHYVHNIYEGLPVIYATIGLLFIFMLLAIIGIGESAKVALVIFVTHLVSLTILVGYASWYIFVNGWGVFDLNNLHVPENGIWYALFFGFAAAMLGISGFESSANFVEEQGPGVFPKTLRNMWIVVSVFNPLIAFLVIAVIPFSEVEPNKEALLSFMGGKIGGDWLSLLISIDAALVLSGAVLTSFVGVGGLVERMTLDRILPQYFLKKNRFNSSFRIVIGFFLLCISILLITQGELGPLAGVYTLSFLSVMALFGYGNMLLKIKRSRLPRPEKATWLGVIIALIAVFMAIAGNVMLNPKYVRVFFQYLIPTLLAISIMLNRILILRTILGIVNYIFGYIRRSLKYINNKILSLINDINSQEFVFFTKNDDISTLNKVLLYIKRNEHTKNLKIVTVKDGDWPSTERLERDIDVLDREYPEIRIEFIEIKGKFGPELITELSMKWKIPAHFMFIGSPGDRFPFRVEELGGVRLII